eukprot:1826577-Rhodomonas_salina.2
MRSRTRVVRHLTSAFPFPGIVRYPGTPGTTATTVVPGVPWVQDLFLPSAVAIPTTTSTTSTSRACTRAQGSVLGVTHIGLPDCSKLYHVPMFRRLSSHHLRLQVMAQPRNFAAQYNFR